jgi:hypothetical protein
MKIKALIKYLQNDHYPPGKQKVINEVIEVLELADKFNLIPAEIDPSTYQEFVKSYYAFRKERGNTPRLTPAAGKALKDIIRYLLQVEKIGGDPQKALEGWNYILKHWNYLNEFLQSQVGLTQINKHLEEIIDKLTHAESTKKRASTNAKSELEKHLKQRKRGI